MKYPWTVNAVTFDFLQQLLVGHLPPADGPLSPSIVPTPGDIQDVIHEPHLKFLAMLFNERISHLLRCVKPVLSEAELIATAFF